jgi:hypothetical protein
MSVTLSLNINDSQTSVRLSGPLDAVPGDLFRLGDEVVSFGGYQLRSHDRRSVVFHRGKSQTTAASHAGGTVVRGVADGLAASADETLPDPFSAGGPGGADLETVLAAGNTTGINTIETPAGTLDGTIAGTFSVAGAPGDTTGAAVELHGGNGGVTGGTASLFGGTDVGQFGSGSHVIAGGSSNDGSGGAVTIVTGDGVFDGNGNGGDLFVIPGAASGTGRNGLVFLNLPTDDPAVAGALWADGLVVKVSVG